MLHLFTLALTAALMSNSPVALVPPLVTAAPSASEIAYLLEAPGRRVRAMTPDLHRALADGLRRSPTFVEMLRALEASDVIVQIVATPLPPHTLGRTLMGRATRDVRYLRIEIGPYRRGDGLVALVGHELRHAVEIAAAPQIRDERALARHYRRIGFSLDGANQFDTAAARAAEQDVRKELAVSDAYVLASRTAR